MPGRNKRRERSLPEPQTQPPSQIPPSSADNLSTPLTKPYFIPPGYKFSPTDQDIIFCFLEPYLNGTNKDLSNVPIHEVNIYESNPEQLSVEFKKGNAKEWFYISERNKMCKGGKKQKRGDNNGHWHAVTSKKIEDEQGLLIGCRTALAYYVGKQPNGVKTKWLMHEYWIDQSTDANEKDYAVCKIYLSPQATKKKEEENEKQKKEEVVVAHVVALEEQVEQQPGTEGYYQVSQALLGSYQPQPRDFAYQQQQFWPAQLHSYQPQPHYIEYQQPRFWPAPSDSHQLHSAYQQLESLMMMTPEEENCFVTQHQQKQQRLILPPPQQDQDSRSRTWWSNDHNIQEALFDMSKDDMFFDINELLKGDVKNDHLRMDENSGFPG